MIVACYLFGNCLRAQILAIVNGMQGGDDQLGYGGKLVPIRSDEVFYIGQDHFRSRAQRKTRMGGFELTGLHL